MKRIFVTGIGTEVGKTVVSAILTEALEADYWKPVQSGAETDSDTETVKALIQNRKSFFHPEAYRLPLPLSPHEAAEAAGVNILLENIKLPSTANHLIIEGAGGLFVPLNQKDLIVDLLPAFGCEVVLVSRNYLGSINHTLLTWEALKIRNIKVLGLVFNGEPNAATENFILNYTGIPKLLSVLPEKALTPEIIVGYARQLRESLKSL
ncbi:ATP-dependent dethiobiotin synthetase BioD [Adhaeribacter aerolatus]|uniref:ATP-dependent dethiobiotin synthetase BioD n=1 Tax=Adhaeribacter aerolatus TaxID=670289 RepID=A0A512B079_9BACT|nr:dethiobiotin synthase [Adhaeribacter aerolatus]GEO05373.1 ATP-dependent dethiobiotin synthetase BioD [Adhaeribacter aerolatus]